MKTTIAVLLALVAVAPNERVSISDPDVRATLAKLDSADLATRRQAFAEVSAQSKQLADGIALILDSDIVDLDLSRRTLAARWLARNAPRTGIPIMVRHIDFRPPNQFIQHLTPLAEYPCGEGLVEAGLDSIPAILAHLRATEIEKVTNESIRLYALVIHELYHKKYGAHGLDAIGSVRAYAGRIRAQDTTNFQRLETQLRTIAK